MTARTGTIWSAHHASWSFVDAANHRDYRPRSALNTLQQENCSDIGSGLVVPENGILTMRSRISRALGDLNRTPDNAFRKQDFCQVRREGRWQDDKHDIWLPGMEPTDAEKHELLQTYYHPYNARILEVLRAATRPTVFVAFDNTPDYRIGFNPDGSDRVMPNIDLANDGVRDTPDVDEEGKKKNILTTCEPEFLEEFAHQLRRALRKQCLCPDVTLNAYDDVRYDQVGDLTRRFSTRRNDLDVPQPVHAIQVEYNRSLTHPQRNREWKLVPESDHGAIEKLQRAFEKAMYETYTCLLTHNVHVINIHKLLQTEASNGLPRVARPQASEVWWAVLDSNQ